MTNSNLQKSLKKSLSLEIIERLLIDNIALAVFVFLLIGGLELFFVLLILEFIPQSQSIFDPGDVGKVSRVRYA